MKHLLYTASGAAGSMIAGWAFFGLDRSAPIGFWLMYLLLGINSYFTFSRSARKACDLAAAPAQVDCGIYDGRRWYVVKGSKLHFPELDWAVWTGRE